MKCYSLFTTLLLFTLFTLNSNAQIRELEIFSEGGEQFILYFNGIQQSAEPVTNVRVGDIQQEFVNVRIVFADQTKGELKKNFPLNPNTLTTGMIKLNKKGEYKLAYRGEVPLAQAPAPAPTQTQVVYSTTPVTETQTTTTTTTTTNTGGGDVNMNVNMMGTGVSVNMTGMDANTTYTETTTTTTTTTSSSGGSATAVPVAASNGDGGCSVPMGDADFNDAKTSIASKSFEDSKMTIAKQITKANCLKVDQVKAIMGQFDYEESKLDFAKFAYPYTYDKGNYYKVNDAFTFETSIEELNEFIGK